MTVFLGGPDCQTSISGVILVDKPSGPTSHDIVDGLRRITGIDRIGHGGTLDPLASGLLPLFVGDATRMSGFVHAHDKSYDFDVTLGVSTETYDSEGAVTQVKPIPMDIDVGRITEVLSMFTGRFLQEPPMYSAVKQKGVPLYKLARKGVTVDRPPREVHVHSLQILSFDGATIRLRTRCSKGTYVRVLAHEIGNSLGSGGHVSYLRRTSVGAFTIQDALPLKTIESLWGHKDMDRVFLGPELVFRDLPGIRLLSQVQFRLQKGGMIPGVWIFKKEGLFQAKDTIRILSQGGQILGLAQALLDSENAQGCPEGIPVAKMCLVFRSNCSERTDRTPALTEKGRLNHFIDS